MSISLENLFEILFFCFQGINTSKAVAQDCEEPDLGKTLSPLGSTSSLQDLMEATSTSAQPTPEPVKATWIERERQKKSVIVIKPKLEAGNIESKSGKNKNVTSKILFQLPCLSIHLSTIPWFRNSI